MIAFLVLTPLLLALAACTSKPTPTPQASFRAAHAPIYSSAVLDPVRLAGHWVQVATFVAKGQPTCAPGQVDITAAQIAWALCLATPSQGAGPMQPGKPGRFTVPGMQDWWVLWADADYRTMVIGTPSGQFGFVLNRDAQLPPDRAKAVRDILTFNGYDLKQAVFFN